MINEKVQGPAELRRSPRKTVFKRAAVVIDGEGRSLDCIARNVSEHGARITLNYTAECPESFKLRLSPDEIHTCRRVWQDGKDFGAEFVEEAQAGDSAEPAECEAGGNSLPRLAGIVFNDGFTFMNCTLLELDEDGARIKPVEASNCPDGFRLACDSNPPRRVTVVIRDDSELQVRFLD
jgi:hypothetical protein